MAILTGRCNVLKNEVCFLHFPTSNDFFLFLFLVFAFLFYS